MARYKHYDYRQSKLLPVSFEEQILPGSFEQTLCYLVDHELDLSVFEERYSNDEEGAPAYDPAILLKIVLLAYSRGVTSSRRIARLCEQNVMFMAVSADSRPHFTTIAHFVSSSPEEIGALFREVVLICDELDLIGGDLFAVDGCKLPSNASKEWSGTRADLKKKVRKLDRAIRRIVSLHRRTDGKEERKGQGSGSPEVEARQKQQVKKLRKVSRKLKQFLATHEEKIGTSGKPIQSNVTDNESSKMKTSRGVIQGYIGVAGVDAKNQVVVHAEAHGQPQEHSLLEPAVEGLRENLETSSKKKGRLRGAKIIADSGYHSRRNVEYLEEQSMDGYIADIGYRGRDPRFATAPRHRPNRPARKRFTVDDFDYDLKKRTCRCPAGRSMWLQCARAEIKGYLFMQFQAHKADCESCSLRSQCLRSEHQTTPRHVNIQYNRTQEKTQSALERMKRKIDSAGGRHVYSFRLGVVEPVFGHITSAIGFKRFSLRGRAKVDGQWKLVTMLHNICKIHRYGWST
jgi:transposase